DIILPSDNVSRRHSRLYTVDGRCYIEDLNSSNGVFVNGRRIHEVYQIQRSAQVKIGDYYLHIESDDAPIEEEERTFCQLSGRNLAFTNQVFRIQRKVSLVGRGKDCGVTIIDPSVSRIHSKLTIERSGALTLEDLKSSNGTFVNDDRIEIATLAHRDIVRFGNVEFLIEIPSMESAPTRSRPASQRVERPSSGADDRRFSTSSVGNYEDDWGARQRSGKMMWLVLSVVGGLLVLGGIFAAIFADELFGDGAGPPEPAAITAPPSETKPAVDPAIAEREFKAKHVVELLELANERAKNKQWKLALESLTKVVDIDALNKDARGRINTIKVYVKHEELLKRARELAVATQRGAAAKKLREILIDKTSVYYDEAREELDRLISNKEMLLFSAETALKQRDCTTAMRLLQELQQIDPRDKIILDKIASVDSKIGTRRCKR
ncbi:MAG: pSer/pThr/pTyr-binding forkhead associated (FHA) protein, partial [Myxococcota bacterium]